LPGNYDFRCDWLEYSVDLSYGRFYQRLLFYPLLGIFIGGILKSRADVPNPPVLAVAVILIQNGCSCFCSYRNRPKSVTPDIEIFTSAPFTSTVFILPQNLNVTDTILGIQSPPPSEARSPPPARRSDAKKANTGPDLQLHSNILQLHGGTCSFTGSLEGTDAGMSRDWMRWGTPDMRWRTADRSWSW
jgi:hypothetical protein